MSSSNNSPTLQGFLRSDGRKGIRNCIVVGYLVECAHHVAREIVDSYRGQPVHLIGFRGCYPNAYADRMMNKLCTHPQCLRGSSAFPGMRELQSPPAC